MLAEQNIAMLLRWKTNLPDDLLPELKDKLLVLRDGSIERDEQMEALEAA